MQLGLILLRVAGVAAVLFTLAGVCATAQDAVLKLPLIKSDLQIIQQMTQCLALGKENLMTPKYNCVEFGSGESEAQASNMPLGEDDWTKVCATKDEPRGLRADTVKRLAQSHDIAPTGIRIIGGVFCDALDLTGLDLPYPLVLDYSLFVGGIKARDLRVKGALSLKNVIVRADLELTSVRVEGSIFTSRSFMKNLMATDTQVQGTWWLNDSIIYDEARLFRVSVAGDLSWNKSAFSRLALQSAQVDGVLDLNRSEARCTYDIRSSKFRYVVADQAGFGEMKSESRSDGSAFDYAWWKRSAGRTKVRTSTPKLFESPIVKRIVDDDLADIGKLTGAKYPHEDQSPRRIPGCERTSKTSYFEFFVFDSTVSTAFCLTSFEWATPKAALPDDTHPVSIISLNGLTVNGKLVIGLGGGQASDKDPRPGQAGFDAVSGKRKFEAIGLTSAELFFDFTDNDRPYFTVLDGLKFDWIHQADPVCKVEVEHEQPIPGVQFSSQPELPSVDDVMHWLDKNKGMSSQPFLVFVEAFEKVGANATELRVRRKNIDLCRRVAKVLPQEFLAPIVQWWRPELASICNADVGGDSSQSDGGGVINYVADLIATSFQVGLWALADHGLRPGKAVWWVFAVMFSFAAWFWLGLRIVGFDPKTGGQQAEPGQKPPCPISFLFLFDRLIPLYKIREEHYWIARYYRLATKAEISGARGKPGQPPYSMSYFGRTFLVCPLDESRAALAEKSLVVLRIIGVGLTIFLLAAINTLTR